MYVKNYLIQVFFFSLNFFYQKALNQTIKEAQARAHLAYFTKNTHNVYLSEPDTSLPETHVFNRQVKIL